MRLLSLSFILILLAYNGSTFIYAADSELYPPGLLPLINRGNTLLSTGQFSEASKVYSEAIGKAIFAVSCFHFSDYFTVDQSSANYLTNYLRYYKRATAYLSLQ